MYIRRPIGLIDKGTIMQQISVILAKIYESLFLSAPNNREIFFDRPCTKCLEKFYVRAYLLSLVIHWLLWLIRALLWKRYASEKRSFIRQTTQMALACQPRSLTVREFIEKQYHEGKLLNIPTRRPWTQEEREEHEQLVQELAGGKPVSESNTSGPNRAT